MLLVDSSVWIDYFNGRSSAETAALDALLGKEPILVGDLMLAEVLQGFRSDRHYRIARDLLLSLDVVNLVDTSIALQSARNFRRLRRAGVTVRKTVDCIIATWCITHGVALLHCDRDFEVFEEHLGLRSVLDRG